MINQTEQDLICQWFNVVQDINPAYLSKDDYVLARRLMMEIHRPVSQKVMDACK